VGQFKAELYEPSEWAKLFKRAGAKWAILTSKHHDGFELWPSPQATSNFAQFGDGWNSAKLGPKRDLLGELVASLREEGLKAGFYHSLFEWYNPLYRGADPKSYVTQKLAPDLRDLVKRYLPDDILVDGEWERNSDFWETKQFLQWLFNDSPDKDTVAVNDRWGNETRGAHGGYYVCENGAYSTFCNGSYGGPAHPVSDHPWIYWATTCPQVRLSPLTTWPVGNGDLLSHYDCHRVHGASAVKRGPMITRVQNTS
jgi:alpha-L-fucosidase